MKEGDEAQYAREGDSDSDDDVLMMVNSHSNTEKTNMWYLDSGCSNHMTGNKNWVTKLDESVKKVIKFVDGRHVKFGGKGDISIVRKDGGKATITEVLYLPSMTSNLINVGQLLAKGFKMKLERNQMKVYRADGRLIMKAPLTENKTFKVEINIFDHMCLASTAVEDKNWL